MASAMPPMPTVASRSPHARRSPWARNGGATNQSTSIQCATSMSRPSAAIQAALRLARRDSNIPNGSAKCAMTKTQATGEVFWTAFQALRPNEKQAVLERLLKDKRLRQDLQDLATIASRKHEAARPFRKYLESSRRRPA